jgi:hypothetical protein
MTRDEWLNLALAVAESAVAAEVLECSEKMHAELAHLAASVLFDLSVAV